MMMLLLKRLGWRICWSGRTHISRSICTASAFCISTWCFSTMDSMKYWWISFRKIRHCCPYCITRRWSPDVMRSWETYEAGLLLYIALFLSMSSLMIRRSVITTAVAVPNFKEYRPPYCLAHSVNLDLEVSNDIERDRPRSVTSSKTPSLEFDGGYQERATLAVLKKQFLVLCYLKYSIPSFSYLEEGFWPFSRLSEPGIIDQKGREEWQQHRACCKFEKDLRSQSLNFQSSEKPMLLIIRGLFDSGSPQPQKRWSVEMQGTMSKSAPHQFRTNFAATRPHFVMLTW